MGLSDRSRALATRLTRSSAAILAALHGTWIAPSWRILARTVRAFDHVDLLSSQPMRSDIPEEREVEAALEELDGPEPADEVVDQSDGAGEGGAGKGDRHDLAEGPEAELAAMKDRYLRLAAEYDNFRKRTDRERSEGRDRAQAQLVERLLEPLDDLQRVAQYSADGTTVDAVLEGVRMVERKLFRALEAAGLETLEARGERFDPSLHEALMMAGTDDAEEDDTVGEVFQAGYRFRGSLLRPARVQVRKHGG
jgi:molecular chaperone GrpE